MVVKNLAGFILPNPHFLWHCFNYFNFNPLAGYSGDPDSLNVQR